MARPSVALDPHESVARAIKRYPRRLPWADFGSRAVAALLCEELFNAVRVKADHDLIADDQRRRAPAVVCTHQFEYGRLVGAYVFFRELNSSTLEERLNGVTGRSAGLREEYHLSHFAHHSSIRCQRPTIRSQKHQTLSVTPVPRNYLRAASTASSAYSIA